ncbi:MAG: terminase large subunit [Bacteroidales bacterium]|jgi:phage terminase large subunit-like protein|nr:terminase large subunit [Bacteroidales bacterium]
MDELRIRNLSKEEVAQAHPYEHYYIDILEGNVLACRKMKLAAIRHFDDKLRIITDRDFPYFLDFDHVETIITIIEMFKLNSFTTLKLMAWQVAFLLSLFGWVDKDGLRRFKESFLQVARKNGKSGLAACIALIHLLIDDEDDAQLYCIATKQEQARIVLGDIGTYISNDENLGELFKQYKHLGETSKILCTFSNGKALALGNNSKTLDGLRPSFCVADEIHEHKDDKLVNVVESGMGNRKQPHTAKITTAGLSTVGYGYSQYEYYCKLLERKIDNDRALAFIFELDEGDKWEDENLYLKSNPSLKVLISLSDLEEMRDKALVIKSYQNEFRSKKLNQWLNGRGDFITQEQWSVGQKTFEDEELLGQKCFGGLDLAQTRDLTAFVLSFPQPDGSVRTKTWSFVPEDTANEKKLSGGIDYESLGVILTGGNAIDEDYIFTVIRQACIDYDVKVIAFDRMFSRRFQMLFYEIGVEGLEHGQGFIGMSPSLKKMEVMAVTNKVHTNADRVLAWCISNLVTETDPAGNIKPAKNKSLDKIDTAVAFIMSIGAIIYWDSI